MFQRISGLVFHLRMFQTSSTQSQSQKYYISHLKFQFSSVGSERLTNSLELLLLSHSSLAYRLRHFSEPLYHFPMPNIMVSGTFIHTELQMESFQLMTENYYYMPTSRTTNFQSTHSKIQHTGS
jgi:hypothetical protein